MRQRNFSLKVKKRIGKFLDAIKPFFSKCIIYTPLQPIIFSQTAANCLIGANESSTKGENKKSRMGECPQGFKKTFPPKIS